MKCSQVALTVVAMLMAINSAPVLAQRDAGAKFRGEYGKGFWYNSRAERNMRHARDYAQDLGGDARHAKQLDPQTAKADSEALGRNIEAAKKELDNARKAAGDDQDTLAALDLIQKHLAAAATTHKTLHAECCKDSVDGSVCATCCGKITKELETAMAEHAALMGKLKAKHDKQEKSPKKG